MDKPTGKFKKLHKAVAMATLWHTGQDRKYSEVPYIVHPLRVMSIVRSVSEDESMLCAAVLHDVVEDTPITSEEIHSEFGTRVGELVGWLTDSSTPADGNRKARKQIDLLHTAAAPADAQTIKLADIIDNTKSITRDDPHFAIVFMAETERLLEALVNGHPVLLDQAKKMLQNYQEGRVQEALRRG